MLKKPCYAGIKDEAYARITPREGSAFIKAKQNLYDAEREARVKSLYAYPTTRAKAFAKWGEKAENGSAAWLTAPKSPPQYNKTKKGTITVRIQCARRILADFALICGVAASVDRGCLQDALIASKAADISRICALISALGILLRGLSRVRLEGFDKVRYIRKSNGGGKCCG